ncbi:MAG: hypothetical protein KDK97_17075, partial [Verrucomicrobiales bacterium]|nr:hypothetical protein [Verrucomicrobiales bacterium]
MRESFPHDRAGSNHPPPDSRPPSDGCPDWSHAGAANVLYDAALQRCNTPLRCYKTSLQRCNTPLRCYKTTLQR